MMTRKDFQLIADVLREHDDTGAASVAMADALATTNERFDRARFLAACNVMDDEVGARVPA